MARVPFTHPNSSVIPPPQKKSGGKKLPVLPTELQYFGTNKYCSPYYTARSLLEGQAYVGATSLRNLMTAFTLT